MNMKRRAGRNATVSPGGGYSYFLRDTFNNGDLGAGSVHGTTASDGTNVRSVTDTGSKLTIASSKVSINAAGGSNHNDPSLAWNRTFARTPGLIAKWTVNASTSSQARMALTDTKNNLTVANRAGFMISGTSLFSLNGSLLPVIGSFSTSTDTELAVALRSTGSMMFSGNQLLYIFNTGSTATLYMNFGAYASVYTLDNVAVAGYWLPTPLSSDGFGTAFGATDGLGHAEGVAGSTGSGGGSVAWTQQVGTWTVGSGTANASVLSGGIAIATVPTSTKDVLASVKVTRAAGQGGTLLRWTDASNHLYAEHDGTNAYLKQVLAGVTTTLITAAATYSAGARLIVSLSGNNARLYYNDTLVGTTTSINAGLTSTTHGIRVTDTTVQLDDSVFYATGTASEHVMLSSI